MEPFQKIAVEKSRVQTVGGGEVSVRESELNCARAITTDPWRIHVIIAAVGRLELLGVKDDVPLI